MTRPTISPWSTRTLKNKDFKQKNLREDKSLLLFSTMSEKNSFQSKKGPWEQNHHVCVKKLAFSHTACGSVNFMEGNLATYQN